MVCNSQSHKWVDSGNPDFHRTALEYNPNHATQGETALKVSGELQQIVDSFELINNSLEIKLKDNLKRPEDWSIYDFVTLDIFMEESPAGLSEAMLTLTNSRGESQRTSLILGWQLLQWENYQMTFPLIDSPYISGKIGEHILKDVVNVAITFYRYSDVSHENAYTEINFHIDNLKLGGYNLWDNFEESNVLNSNSINDKEDIVIYSPKESNLEIGFSKTNGAISHITNKKTKEVISQGNLEGNLWTMSFNNNIESALLKSKDFSRKNKSANFSYDLKAGSLSYRYDINKEDFITVDIDLSPSSKDEIRLKAQVTNKSNLDIRKLSLVEKLCVKTDELEEALWPMQEGLILLPSFFKENRSSVMHRPPMFADLIAMKTHKSTLGIYLVQDENYHQELIPYHDDSDPVFQPSNLCIGGLSDHAYMHFEMASYITKNEVWTSPSLIISIDKDFQSLATSYRDANGFNHLDKYPSLKDKIGDDQKFEQFKKSPIYSIDMYKVLTWDKAELFDAWNYIANEWLPKLKYKGILHFSHWQLGRSSYDNKYENHMFDDDHPSALSIWWGRYGSEKSFKSLLDIGESNGFTFMPFTNWTIWNKIDVYTGKLPPLEDSPMAVRKIRGTDFPFYQYRGYMVEPWDDAVRAINDKMFETYTSTYPQDYVFVDMTGERPWRYVLSESNKPSAHVYTQAVINENVRLSKAKPIITEGVFDRILNSVSGYGQTFRQRFWNMTIAHLGDEYIHWAPYPLAAFVAHDKVAFYQHNPNSETWSSDSNALLSYFISHGYNLSIDLTVLKYEEEGKIKKMAAMQNLLASRTCGEKLISFKYLTENRTKVKSTWGSTNAFNVVANFDYNNKGETYQYEDSKISPNGFYAYDNKRTVEGGIFRDLYNNEKLSPGDHTLILENSLNEIKVNYLEGNGTDLSLNIPANWNKDDIIIEVYDELNDVPQKGDFSIENNKISFKLDPVLRIAKAEPFTYNKNIDFVLIKHLGEIKTPTARSNQEGVYWSFNGKVDDYFSVFNNKLESEPFFIDFGVKTVFIFIIELLDNNSKVIVQLMENESPNQTREIGVMTKSGNIVLEIEKENLWQGQEKEVKLVLWIEGPMENVKLKSIKILENN